MSPILGVHLFFERPVLQDDRRAYPHLVLPGRDTHWFFDKGTVTDETGPSSTTSTRSSARRRVDAAERGRDRRTGPRRSRVGDARGEGIAPVDVRTVKERKATFRAEPGIDAMRPGPRPGGRGIPNLYLAGDWCDTGWPATMEGAARSGYAAAEAITGEGGVVPDVPPGWLVSRLGLR